jgi:hypothetical protein
MNIRFVSAVAAAVLSFGTFASLAVAQQNEGWGRSHKLRAAQDVKSASNAYDDLTTGSVVVGRDDQASVRLRELDTNNGYAPASTARRFGVRGTPLPN